MDDTDTTRILVIGYGNPLRADDGAGGAVAERLAAGIDDRRVTIVDAHQLMPEHVTLVSGADRVVFVDASCEVAAGAFRCAPIEPAGEIDQPLGHQMRPEALLAWADSLYGARPQACLYAIGVGSLEFGFGLTEPIEPIVQQVADEIDRRIRGWLTAPATEGVGHA
jgi:hydrogenase maturation protease